MPFGLIGDIFSSVVGERNTDKANKTNLQINRMNNEFNAREAEKAFQREVQYNNKVRAEDRAYNSAAQQVERYRQAGLNPTIMMQGQSAGMAQSNGVGSSVASAAPSAPQQAFTPSINGSSLIPNLISALSAKEDIKQKNLINRGLEIENRNKEKQILADIADKEGSALAHKARAKLDETIERIQPRLMDSQIRANDMTAKLTEAQHDYQLLINKKAPEKLAVEIALNKALTDESKFKSKSAIKDIIESYEKSYGKLPEGLKSAIYLIVSSMK